jgi:GTP cyclohydrolase I
MDKERIEKAVREILFAVGEDPDREGLIDTPKRIAKMYEEIFSGLDENPADHLEIYFQQEKYEELVLSVRAPLGSVLRQSPCRLPA